MKAMIVYESMYGNTHAVADAIGQGLGPAGEITVVPVGRASQELLSQADLVVVGGPTHIHGMSRRASRQSAVEAARKPDSSLVLDPAAESGGVRDWLASLGRLNVAAAAFDTRLDGLASFTGRASKGISGLLRHHGFMVITEPESFLVTKANELYQGEPARATRWGASLAAKAAAATGSAAAR
jgi:hypothetical protein